ncbi:endonuclease domain-containing protein [Pinibacter aurantiacus]|uniref:DUF559 domain-containing protein n=1 Tax=Pinibacter aurantiacus TaxID=2851599 RepID=A0A9E2W7L0_9BACT|nr:DUF559 domain-containing protein [Pinibacter aurantiacus]MBV4356462.1 DUF559 domain-containing protein [Pinibacter aurantiacus]
MKRRIIHPYNPLLKELAKKLRSSMTFSEVKLWNVVKNKKMLGYDFDRQRPIKNYIVDFYCKDLQLALEVDGITHASEIAVWKDEIRQREIEELGISFLRFNALDVVHDIENAQRTIENWILEYEERNGVDDEILRKRTRL